MPASGKILVVLSADQCRASATWLRHFEPAPPTLLSSSDTAAEIQMAHALRLEFAKRAQRKTGPVAGRQIDRQLAVWFGSLDVGLLRGVRISQPVLETMRACRAAAAAKRVGRPEIQRDEAHLADTIKGMDDRYMRKMRRRARYQRRFADWLLGLSANRQTLVTSDSPPKK